MSESQATEFPPELLLLAVLSASGGSVKINKSDFPTTAALIVVDIENPDEAIVRIMKEIE